MEPILDSDVFPLVENLSFKKCSHRTASFYPHSILVRDASKER